MRTLTRSRNTHLIFTMWYTLVFCLNWKYLPALYDTSERSEQWRQITYTFKSIINSLVICRSWLVSADQQSGVPSNVSLVGMLSRARQSWKIKWPRLKTGYNSKLLKEFVTYLQRTVPLLTPSKLLLQEFELRFSNSHEGPRWHCSTFMNGCFHTLVLMAPLSA